jgi:DNA-directed RNA polymerase specialized sigma24 family protein
MDSDHSCLATMVLDSQAFAHQVEALEHFVPDRFATLVGLAQRLLGRYRIADPAFDAEDAVQAALLKVFQAVKDGKINLFEAEEDLLGLLRHKLDQEVLTEREREHTRKRGGPGASHDEWRPVVLRDDANVEKVDSRTSAPEERVTADDQVEWLLGLLDLYDPGLRVVATMKTEGFTHEEIAARVGQPLSAVERRVRLIKAIFGRCHPDLSARKLQKSAGF